MFIVQREFVRPTTDVPFFEGLSVEYKNYWKSLKDNGKVIGTRTSMSADRLTKTLITAWQDEVSWNDYCSNPLTISMINDRDSYGESNNIVTRRETKQV